MEDIEWLCWCHAHVTARCMLSRSRYNDKSWYLLTKFRTQKPGEGWQLVTNECQYYLLSSLASLNRCFRVIDSTAPLCIFMESSIHDTKKKLDWVWGMTKDLCQRRIGFTYLLEWGYCWDESLYSLDKCEGISQLFLHLRLWLTSFITVHNPFIQ